LLKFLSKIVKLIKLALYLLINLVKKLEKAILHLDLDSFFVSVERLLKPELMGKPVIVGSDQGRAVVSSCSYEARKFGVHSGMSGRQAKKLCPDAIFTFSTNGEYSYYSNIVTEIVREMVPVMYKASIDEFYCDLSGLDAYYGSWHLAKNLRKRIIRETGLPISMGLSSNKVVSKIATGEAKPNGELMIPKGMEKRFLFPLKAEKIPGVGEKTLPVLHKHHIYTIGDIAKQDVGFLESILGIGGYYLHLKANGIYESDRYYSEDRKSISTENTFQENIQSEQEIESVLKGMVEKLCYSLRSNQLATNCITLKLRLPNYDTFTKQIAIQYTHQDKEIFDTVKSLRKAMMQTGMELMLIGVRFSNLKPFAVQTNLFVDNTQQEDVTQSIDRIRNKYGLQSIYRADSYIRYRQL
jgi:DNA polymerase IV